MSTVGPIAAGTAVTFKVNSIVNDIGAASTAGGYAAFIYSITGAVPVVVNLEGDRCRMVLSSDQIVALRAWLDKQVQVSFTKKTPAKVEYNLTPALAPWALKFALPAGIGFFLLGLLAGRYIVR